MILLFITGCVQDIQAVSLIPDNPQPVNDSAVSPIDWKSFRSGNPNDSSAERFKTILLNSHRYALTTWWNEVVNFDEQSNSRYLDFGGNAEHDIRAPATQAFALSVSLRFGFYGSSKVDVPIEEARAKTLKLIRSIAFRHLANSPGGWGNHWQSAQWTHSIGLAAWLLWEDLNTEEREHVRKMVEYEADRLINYKVPYWVLKSGKVVYPGDTKAEENAWNANALQLAAAMMPKHGNYKLWMRKYIELRISSVARPSDMYRTDIFHGVALKDWLNGYNINNDGTVINHDRIHPDYMVALIGMNSASSIVFTLANQPTPKAVFLNLSEIYSAMVNLKFSSPPYAPPGGTIYQEGSSNIYYPQGNDWGTHRRMHFALMDLIADSYGLDKGLFKKGKYWEPYHSKIVIEMQNRSKDRRTYIEDSEDTYKGREGWIAYHAAYGWLHRWVSHSGCFKVTNEPY
jgi:hypothetical protein